jgi:hypothetical protein
MFTCTMKMEVEGSSESLVTVYHTTQSRTAEEYTLFAAVQTRILLLIFILLLS